MKMLFNSGRNSSKILSVEDKLALFSAFDELYLSNSAFRSLDIKKMGFELTLSYSRSEFKDDVIDIVKQLNDADKALIWNCFGFQIESNFQGQMVMSGYPTLSNLQQNQFGQNRQMKKIFFL